jgi:hypothetical protein
LIYVDGEPLIHVSTDGYTWLAPDIDLQPEALAQLVSGQVGDEILARMAYEPLSFPCSEFGKKVVRGAKYLWIAASTAVGLACCVDTVGVGCIACGSAAAVAAEWGGDIADDYCA